MTASAKRLLNDLVPGQYLDIDSISPDIRDEFLNLFEGQGYVLSSNSQVGEIETCDACEGEGMAANGRDECRRCSGYSLTVDYGEGKRPYRD